MGSRWVIPKGQNDPASNIWIRSWINFSCHFLLSLSGTYFKQSKMIQFNIFKTAYGEKLGRRGRMIWRRKRRYRSHSEKKERHENNTKEHNKACSEWQKHRCVLKAVPRQHTAYSENVFVIYDLWISILCHNRMTIKTELENSKFNFRLYYVTDHFALSGFLCFGFLIHKMKAELKTAKAL